MKNALVIGGSGMLSQVSLWLVDHDYRVSVVGRNAAKMERMIRKATNPSRIHPVYVDYSQDLQFRSEIQSLIERQGPIDLVVAWIHSYGRGALDSILEVVSEGNQEVKLFHVLGSSSNLNEIKERISVPENCEYYQVQLGFMIEEDGASRWLTHGEISGGVIEAISGNKSMTVGVLEPWDKRP